jgi:hypothetical protein
MTEMSPKPHIKLMITIIIGNMTALNDLKKINSVADAMTIASRMNSFSSRSTFCTLIVLIYGRPE